MSSIERMRPVRDQLALRVRSPSLLLASLLASSPACVGQLGSVDSTSTSDTGSDEGVDLCPCESPLVCSFGFCTAPPFEADCEEGNAMDTVCPSNALCLAIGEEANGCYPMPACPSDGVCPIGEFGALCNQGGFPTKDSICLVGSCDGPEHCPADANCVQPSLGYGNCSFGGFGELCSQDDHCDSGNCIAVGAGFGFCG